MNKNIFAYSQRLKIVFPNREIFSALRSSAPCISPKRVLFTIINKQKSRVRGRHAHSVTVRSFLAALMSWQFIITYNESNHLIRETKNAQFLFPAITTYKLMLSAGKTCN